MALGTDLGTGMPDGAEAHYRAIALYKDFENFEEKSQWLAH